MQMRRIAVSVGLFLPVFAATYGASFLLRFAGESVFRHLPLLLQTLPWVLAVKMGVAIWCQLHQGWSRYVTFHDMLQIAQVVIFSSVGITLVDALLVPQLAIPRSIILLDWGCTLMALSALRGLPRLLRDGGWKMFAPPRGTPALIVGANDTGEALLRAIRRTRSLTVRPVGFVDDRVELHGRRIGGVPVVGPTANIAELADKYRIEEVLITAGELPGKQVRALVEAARGHSFRVKVLPSYEQLLGEHVAVQPRPVLIEDLLRRPSIQIDMDNIHQWLSGRTLLITGSAGSIGAEICRQLLRLSPAKLVLVDRAETGQFFIDRELRCLNPDIPIEACMADITDRDRMEAVFRQFRPDTIFHSAAYKHVPLMEAHAGEAVKNIVLATRDLVELADQHGASGLVMISTDKAVNPTSVMGSCKRLAEQYVQARAPSTSCRLVTVRFGNVLDSAGSVIPIFRDQIARGGPVTVTHAEMVRYFMLIPEAAQLVIQAGAMGKGGEIFVLDMGEPVRILDLAQDMIRLSGLRVEDDIEIKVIGLRPGEKLYEELYGDSEHHQRTPHEKIMVANGLQRPFLQVNHDINRLETVVNESNEVVQAALREIIPIHETVTPTNLPAAA